MAKPYKMSINSPEGPITAVVCDEDEYWEALRSVFSPEELAPHLSEHRLLIRWTNRTSPIFEHFSVEKEHLLALSIRSNQVGLIQTFHDPEDPSPAVNKMNELYDNLNYLEKEFVDELIEELLNSDPKDFFTSLGEKIAKKFSIQTPNAIWRNHTKRQIIPSYIQTIMLMIQTLPTEYAEERIKDYTRRFMTLMFVTYKNTAPVRFKPLKDM